MKIGSVALKTAFAGMLALTAVRWMVPVPAPVVQRQVDIPGLAETAPHAAERTFFLPVTEPALAEAAADEPDSASKRSDRSRPNPQQMH